MTIKVCCPNGRISSQGSILVDYAQEKIYFWCDWENCPINEYCNIKDQGMTIEFEIKKEEK